MCSPLNCLSGMKVLFEGVVKVDAGQPLALTIAVYLVNLISSHAYMAKRGNLAI